MTSQILLIYKIQLISNVMFVTYEKIVFLWKFSNKIIKKNIMFVFLFILLLQTIFNLYQNVGFS